MEEYFLKHKIQKYNITKFFHLTPLYDEGGNTLDLLLALNSKYSLNIP